MQAISTKYLNSTNSRGARVKASCDTASVTVYWDHALDIDGNHRAAAMALAAKLGWEGTWVGGSLPNRLRGNCYVCVQHTQGDSFSISKGKLK